MADYVQSIDFSVKDALPKGDPGKKIKGADLDTELALIAVAIASKHDSSSNLNMQGFRHTNVGAAQSRTDYARVDQLMDQALVYYQDAGSGDAYAINPEPAISSYVDGQRFVFKAAATSSGGATLSVNGLTARPIVFADGTLPNGAIVAGGIYEVTYDAAGLRWLLTGLSPAQVSTMLGLGELATKSTINNSDWSGTDLAVANGGTGASDAATARANLGAAAANHTHDSDDITDIGALATLNVAPIANGGTGATSAAQARANLGVAAASHTHSVGDISGLGSLATLNTINNSNWSGTDLAIANGGTGASDAATARANLGAAADSAVVKLSGNQTIGGVKTFSSRPKGPGGGGILSYASSGNEGGSITISTSNPSGTPADGDIWIVREA